MESKRGRIYREPSNEVENLEDVEPMETDELVDGEASVE